jgi:hypothetical protein
MPRLSGRSSRGFGASGSFPGGLGSAVAILDYAAQERVMAQYLYEHAGVPTDGTNGTYAHIALPGALLIDTDAKTLYQNTGTQASPVWTERAPSGGGSTPNLAAVLAEGNDTGGTEIVHAPAANANANVNRSATATGLGSNAAANTVASATASVGGEATATQTASATAGNASVNAAASSADGTATANRSADSTTWDAEATTSASAGGGLGARVFNDATGNDTANAATRLNAFVNGSGRASAELRAFKDGDDATGAGMRVEATAAGGYKMGFGEVAAAPIAIPEVAASPTVQQVVDALVALGLITQAA